MANKYVMTVILSMLAGAFGIALLHVVWPVLDPLPVFMQYAITGVGGVLLGIHLADMARRVIPPDPTLEMGSDGRQHAMSADGGAIT